MQQTTNFQLNQWEPEDRILRTDFNNDNLSIDAALKAGADAIAAETAAREALARQVTLQQIFNYTSTAAANYYSISLAGINWSAWKCVHLIATPKLPADGNCSATFNFDGLYTLASNLSMPLHLILWPLNNGGTCVRGLRFGNGGAVVYYAGLPFFSIRTLELNTNNSGKQLQPGTTLVVYGEKG